MVLGEVNNIMSVSWVNYYYDMNIKKGQRVGFMVFGERHYGIITSVTNRVFVKGEQFPRLRLNFHPKDIIILEEK